MKPRRDPTTRSVLVTAARGKTGRAVVDELSARPGWDIRGGTSAAPAPGAVAFDWQRPETWAPAAHGVDAVFLVRPELPQAPELIARFLGQAPQAQVVLLSEQGAGALPEEDWVRQVERAVTDHARTWTILRPSWFQQVLTDHRFYLAAIRDQRLLSLPTDGSAVAWVDTRDIARVAVEVMQDAGRHHGQYLTLTGPEALTVDEVAACLSVQIGHAVQSESPDRQAALAGLDPWMHSVLDELFQRVECGVFAEVTSTVRDLTGREASPLRGFIGTHRELWSTPLGTAP